VDRPDPTADEPEIPLRIMVFNIEEGGEGVDLGKVVDAIRAAEADIVALQEAVTNAGRIAAALGWAFASDRSQVTSRFPIVEPADAVGAYVLVEVRPGRVVAVASVHTPAEPYGPELAGRGGTEAEVIALERRIRLPKLDAHLRTLPGLAVGGIPVFLLGDFNAPSHLDWTADAVGLRWHVRRPVDWPMSRAVEAAGFRDAWRETHPDPVAEPGLTWWARRPPTGGYEPGPDTPNDRIDLLYAAGPAVVRDCQIAGEPGAPDVTIEIQPWPSDHRAVVALFDVVPAPMPGAIEIAPTLVREAVPTLRVDRAAYAVGDPIDVTWRGGPGFRWDWIAVFAASVEDVPDAHLVWRHTGARVDGTVRIDADAAIVDQSSVGGRWPLPPGEYVAAYLLDDGPAVVARVPFRIIP
jgi:endonuclease/exonuclease/phosphatase family metal-dependent hydrolase